MTTYTQRQDGWREQFKRSSFLQSTSSSVGKVDLIVIIQAGGRFVDRNPLSSGSVLYVTFRLSEAHQMPDVQSEPWTVLISPSRGSRFNAPSFEQSAKWVVWRCSPPLRGQRAVCPLHQVKRPSSHTLHPLGRKKECPGFRRRIRRSSRLVPPLSLLSLLSFQFSG